MRDIVRFDSNAKLSRAVAFGGLVFLSGQTADDWTQGIEQQCKDALAKVDGHLAQAGTDNSRLVSAQIWMKHVERDFAAMNAVWSAWLPPGCAPARATAQCDLAAADILVEFIIIAATAHTELLGQP